MTVDDLTRDAMPPVDPAAWTDKQVEATELMVDRACRLVHLGWSAYPCPNCFEVLAVISVARRRAAT